MVASPCSQYDGDIKLYDMVDVWVKIQDVLQSAETLAASVFSGNSPLILIFDCSVRKLYLASALFWYCACHLSI
ncbi:hypothetical protein llap_21799 [Limosa lapponica baueri]|uniref:Uncharacterized protein n=1 Tax=Limosa lapponica baueri TaxID=1758121 RepID=A0A2I0T272_LIMLA|nr:hypothetical protein llap_21799 [Limosa lapponica baueri]